MALPFRAFCYPGKEKNSRFVGHLTDARTVGRVSQWLEQENTPTPVGRPGQVYNGASERDYTPASKHSTSARRARFCGRPSTGLGGAWRRSRQLKRASSTSVSSVSVTSSGNWR